jgi:hypothetical protein
VVNITLDIDTKDEFDLKDFDAGSVQPMYQLTVRSGCTSVVDEIQINGRAPDYK